MSAHYTPGQEAAFEAFGRAVRQGLEGGDFRYPEQAEFIALDLDHAGQMAWEALREGRDVIFVDPKGAEFWFHVAHVRRHQQVLNRLLRRVTVMIYERAKPAPAEPATLPLIYTAIRSDSLVEKIPRRDASNPTPA